MKFFEVGPLYASHYNSKAFIDISQGGTASGKTYTIMQLLFTHAIETPRTRITVVGQDIPNLKRGSFRDAETIYSLSPDLQYFFELKRGDRIFICRNGSFIEFVSYDDDQDAKNGKRDILFINEANGVKYSIYWQLYMRTTRKIYLDYNPSARFWVHENVMGRNGVNMFISDHRHNPFISESDHKKIEYGIEDPELWRVYARGLTGKIRGLVFPNYQIVEDMPNEFKRGPWFGMDFGYTIDPTSLVKAGVVGDKLYLDEIIYERGLTNPDIAQNMRNKGIKMNAEIIADSSEPKSIDELIALGFNRVEGAKKGPDSIKAGIDIMKRYKICITRRSTGLLNEFKQYVWMKDKNGNELGKPFGKLDHGIDAARYVALNRLYVQRKKIAPKASIGSFLDFD